MKSLFQLSLILIFFPLLAGGNDNPVQHLDLDADSHRQIVVDREKGQYLGHPTTCLLEDGKTILCVYPKGHGRGGIVYKRSTDGGLTWSDRLPTPESWATSKEVPTLHRVVDANGKKRIIMWSGLYPARLAVTEDDGDSWSELEKVGDWGGIVVMGTVFERKTGPGHYMALFHDDGRFFEEKANQRDPIVFTLFSTTSEDGGLTWSFPKAIYESSVVHLCEPGSIRSPDGKQIAVLLRENARRKNSHIMFSDDEGKTWSEPREMPASLNGDRHTGRYTDDGRLFISFRSNSPKGRKAEFEDDWVAWVGKWEDLFDGKPGQYQVRLKDNHKGADTAYPGVELLPDNTIVTTTYGHWVEGEEPYILSVRLKLEELDALALQQTHPPKTVFEAGQDGYNVFRIPAIVAAANGDLLAFCEAREEGDASEIDLVLKRSSDNGETWGALEVVQESDDFLSLFGDDPPEITVGNAAPVVDLLDPNYPGRIWLPFTLENDRVFVTCSDDHGATWSERREITPEVKLPDWGWYATGPVHSIQIQRGPHRGRLVIPCDHRLGEDGADRGSSAAHAILSDDHGKTWRIGALDETYEDGLNANETTVVELTDGTLYFNTRDQNGKAPGTRGEAWSRDGGETFEPRHPEWKSFRPANDVIDPPVVQCALLRVSNDLLLFSGPDDNGPSGKGRSDLRIRYSTDEAKTWQDGPLIYTGPAAYSDMVRIEGGQIGILFEAGDPGQKSAYQRIEFAVIDGETISESQDAIIRSRRDEFLKIAKLSLHDIPIGTILARLGAKMEAGVSPDQWEGYSRQFTFTDRDSDGRHSKPEYIENGNYLTPQARRGIFNAADSNQDGYVTKAEYVLNRIITDEAKAIVQAMDEDGNGVVEMTEFTESASTTLTDAKLAAAVFGALDTNGDGEIVVPEYLGVWGLWARVGRKTPEDRLAAFGKQGHGGTQNP